MRLDSGDCIGCPVYQWASVTNISKEGNVYLLFLPMGLNVHAFGEQSSTIKLTKILAVMSYLGINGTSTLTTTKKLLEVMSRFHCSFQNMETISKCKQMYISTCIVCFHF